MLGNQKNPMHKCIGYFRSGRPTQLFTDTSISKTNINCDQLV